MSAAKAAIVRAALKANGWGRNEVSVRSPHYGSIGVVVKTAGIRLPEVERIASQVEDIRRDHFGEILEGGNTFVSVRYADDALDALRAEAEAEIATLKVGKFLVWRGFQVVRTVTQGFEIIDLGPCATALRFHDSRDPREAAGYVAWGAAVHGRGPGEYRAPDDEIHPGSVPENRWEDAAVKLGFLKERT